MSRGGVLLPDLERRSGVSERLWRRTGVLEADLDRERDRDLERLRSVDDDLRERERDRDRDRECDPLLEERFFSSYRRILRPLRSVLSSFLMAFFMSL